MESAQAAQAAQGRKPSGKLCLKGLCPCRVKLIDAPGKFRLASNLDERAEELKHVFPGGRSAIPEQLMLPWGTGEGFLGDVRIGAHHYRREDLKVETRGGIGACIHCSSTRHHRHSRHDQNECT